MSISEITNSTSAKRIAVVMIVISALLIGGLIAERSVEFSTVLYDLSASTLLGLIVVLVLTLRNTSAHLKSGWIIFVAIVLSLSAVTLTGYVFIIERFIAETNPFVR